MAAVKLRICTSSRIAPEPLALYGDEVTHFYDILTAPSKSPPLANGET